MLCRSFRSKAARFLTYRMRTRGDDIVDEEDEEDDEEDDEWGIIDVQPDERQPSAVQLACTIQGVRVSLLVVLSPRRRASFHLRLQQSLAKWTFMETEGRLTNTGFLSQTIQVPTFSINFMTAAHFEAYVADRLEISLRRHIERTSGSRLCWTPRLTPHSRVYDAVEALPINLESEDLGGSETQHGTREADAKVIVMPKPKRSFKTFPVNANARYMDYERSAKYIANRQDNIERRYAALSSSLKTQLPSAKEQRLATTS